MGKLLGSCTEFEDVLRKCADVSTSGTGATIYAIPYEKWNKATLAYNADNDIVISSITLPFGARLQKVELTKKNTFAPNPSSSQGASKVNRSFEGTMNLAYVNPFFTKFVEKITSERHVYFYQDQNNGGQWRIGGWIAGVEAESSQEANNADTAGGYAITLLASEEESQEPAYFGTYTNADDQKPTYDKVATETALQALTVKEKKAITAGTAGATTTFTVANTLDIPVCCDGKYQATFSGFTDANLLALNNTTVEITVISDTQFTVAYDSTGATVFNDGFIQ